MFKEELPLSLVKIANERLASPEFQNEIARRFAVHQAEERARAEFWERYRQGRQKELPTHSLADEFSIYTRLRERMTEF